MNRFQSHCSRHAKESDLLQAVTDIGAKSVFPIHTEKPDRFSKIGSKITIVQENKPYKI